MESTTTQTSRPHEPWNKGKLVGQKAPLKLKEVWAIRVWLQLQHRTLELALFDLGLDSGCGPAIWSNSGCVIFAMGTVWPLALK